MLELKRPIKLNFPKPSTSYNSNQLTVNRHTNQTPHMSKKNKKEFEFSAQ
jgi:hypothetical protein